MALQNILGFFPTYMRPPYSSCNSACQNEMMNLGYHVIYFDLDTEDYLHDSPLMIQASKNIVGSTLRQRGASESDYLSIMHDIHEQTAYNLTEYFLKTLRSYNFRPTTVGDCLNDPP